jgi:pimeloyl-ACP methyl ester carboxylesterase
MTGPAAATPAFRARGAGETAVLLLHGIGGGAAIWDDEASATITALAAAGHRVLAVDLPGYGESAALGAPDMDAFVAGVRAVMAAARAGGARRTVLVGHSMGGMVAQELLARDPAGVDALVLACTSAAFGPPGGDWQARFVAERLAPLDAGLGMAGMARRLVPGMVAPQAAEAAREAAIAVMARVPEATYRAALRTIAAFDRRAALASIAVPTLLIAGAHDRTAPPEVMQRMAARIAGSRFVVLPDAGHIANVEAPGPFNAALLEFLGAHLAAG